MRRSLIALALGSLLLALSMAFGVVPACSRHDGGADEGTPVDTEIMAFLSEARALHHEANIKEESGDLAGAVSAMERLVAARRPHADGKGTKAMPPSPPEVEEVLADAYARLAELRLKKGELDPAAGAVESGLEHVAEATYFRGHLVEVQGLVEEARAAQLADAGDAAGAAKAREHAIQLLEEVVKIQDQVIQRSLGKDGG